MLFWKTRSSTSNAFRASNASKTSRTCITYSPLTSKISVKLIHVLKASYNNQCPHEWFITQTMTTRFKTLVNVITIAYISTLMLQNNCLLPTITLKNGLFEFQYLFKHDYLISKYCFHYVFEFSKPQLPLTHAFSHSCLPFPKFFVHLIIFCKLL